MALFKSRKGGDEPAATARQSESIEAMRRRAKHRLIGASVLVLVGVIGFPLLFDTQPRPISVDIPIEIPDRNKVKPLPAAAPAPAPAVTQAAPPVQAPAPASAPASVAKVESPPPKVEAKVETPPEPKAETKAPALEAKPLATTPVIAEGRFVVQVGAFADVAKARETRAKLEHAGMKTYTQVVETKDGKRIRVRVGPFASKADAQQAAERVKGLDLQAAVLTL
jgi:DedD protein